MASTSRGDFRSDDEWDEYYRTVHEGDTHLCLIPGCNLCKQRKGTVMFSEDSDNKKENWASVKPRRTDDTMSPSIGAITKALAAAQGELEAAKKDSVNPHFKSSYADLTSIWQACRGPLSKHGLAVTQTTEVHPGATLDEGVCLVTMLSHESGEWLKGKLFIPASKKDAQGFGSAITYARRYALAAIVGISSDDDDGEAAVKVAPVRAAAAKSEDPFPLLLAAAKTPDEMMGLANSLRDERAAGHVADEVYKARKLAWTTRMANLGGK